LKYKIQPGLIANQSINQSVNQYSSNKQKKHQHIYGRWGA